MNTSYLNKIFEQLTEATRDKAHPYRLCTLGTVGLDRMARLRTVVLREVLPNRDLLVFTDRRSKKVTHLKENNMVGMLFYDAASKVQVKVEGAAKIVRDGSDLQQYWSQIGEENRKDYTSSIPPGSIVSHPDEVEYLKDKDYFCAIQITPYKMEYLELQPEHHIKLRFSKKEGSWVSEYLVP